MTNNDFCPPRWLPGPHAQSIVARWLRSHSGVQLLRERLELADGDFLDLDWVISFGGFEADGQPLVLVLHGLEGSARSGYAFEMYRALARRGIAGVGLNFRSCSGEVNRLPRSYHSGETGDLRMVLGTLAGRFPGRPIGVVGFSLGGNVLVKYLGEEGKKGNKGKEIVRASVAVSVPYDLAAGSEHVERGFSKVYRAYLMRKLRRKIAAKREVLEGLIDVGRTLRTVTFREFDDAATAPLHGFSNADDYYERSSSRAFVKHVAVPALLLHSADDPFLPRESVPAADARANPNITTAFTASGGHVGFLEGRPWARRFWAEERAADFLQQQLGQVAG
jgi:predicted alpha/beta-fold hydrolase